VNPVARKELRRKATGFAWRCPSREAVRVPKI
jgi:hypothetical protein